MIGMPTGPASGIDVLDIDLKPDEYVDGFKCVPQWESLSPIVVRTPSGGAHLWFKSEGKVRNSTDRIGPGVDTRGDGGYAILPPSHNESRGYVFDKGSLADIDAADINKLPPFPTALFDKLTPYYPGQPGDSPEADPELIAAALIASRLSRG
jgi:hypothetical protein